MKIETFSRSLAVATLVWGATLSTSSSAFVPDLKKEIQQGINQVPFDTLFSKWERQYGVQAVEPLLNFARQKNATSAERYLALMGAARLGGVSIQHQITPFLDDHDWELRSAALRSLSALHARESAQGALRLLKDPALVVRLAAVETALNLKPEGVSEALLSVLEDQSNYYHGNPLWVPPRALNALRKLGIPSTLRARYQRWALSLRVKDFEFKKSAASLIR